jgi:hypothetical protein
MPRNSGQMRRLPVRFALVLALGTALATTGLAYAQTAPAPGTPIVKDGYKAPRTAFGQPDLQGVWSNASLTPPNRPAALGTRLTYSEAEVAEKEAQVQVEIEEGDAPTDPNAPADFKPASTNTRPEFAAAGGEVGGYNRGWLDPGNHVMRVGGVGRTSILITENGQFPPRKAGAVVPPAPQMPAGSGSFDTYERRSAGERCIVSFGRNGGPPMLANGFYNNNYQFVQTPDNVVITVEMNHDARIVRLNSKHRTDYVRPYFGDSIGWWDGDTLVVETTNIPRSQQFAGSWENLKVTEKFTRVAEDRLHYVFTIEDPTMWDKPWSGEYEFHPLGNPLFEYACHEGNHALPGILGGARVQEAQAAAEAAKKVSATKPAKGKGKN